jgi:hypothetical protein
VLPRPCERFYDDVAKRLAAGCYPGFRGDDHDGAHQLWWTDGEYLDRGAASLRGGAGDQRDAQTGSNQFAYGVDL